MTRSADKILNRYKTFLFDCDGAKDLLQYLLDIGRKVFLISNNSKLSVEQYVSKCQKLGLPIGEHNIICSSNVLAHYIQRNKLKGPFYIVGEEGIGLELDKIGVKHFGIGTSGVIVGFDKYFNYRKLTIAATYISRNLPFLATNEDAQFPADGLIIPGTGSVVTAVKVASGRDPVVMGKPHKPTFDLLVNSFNVDPKQTLMIGDRLDTDILFGKRFGMTTACVMTGVTSKSDIDEAEVSKQDLVPDLQFDSVADLLQCLRETAE